MQIFDVGNPAAPALAGAVPTSSGPSSLAVSGRYACVGNTNSVQIFDISNPAAPFSAGSINRAPGRVSSRWRRYAYIANENSATNGLQVFDISKPASPRWSHDGHRQHSVERRGLGPIRLRGGLQRQPAPDFLIWAALSSSSSKRARLKRSIANPRQPDGRHSSTSVADSR